MLRASERSLVMAVLNRDAAGIPPSRAFESAASPVTSGDDRFSLRFRPRLTFHACRRANSPARLVAATNRSGTNSFGSGIAICVGVFSIKHGFVQSSV